MAAQPIDKVSPCDTKIMLEPSCCSSMLLHSCSTLSQRGMTTSLRGAGLMQDAMEAAEPGEAGQPAVQAAVRHPRGPMQRHHQVHPHLCAHSMLQVLCIGLVLPKPEIYVLLLANACYGS